MADRNRVGSRIKADLVRSRMRSGAAAARIDWLAVAALFHLFNQREQRSRGRVLFRRMVNFPRPRAILGLLREQPRRLRNYLIEHARAHREIRAPHKSRSATLDS